MLHEVELQVAEHSFRARSCIQHAHMDYKTKHAVWSILFAR